MDNADMKLELEITSVVIVESYGTDTVLVNTTLPEASWPFEGGLTMRFSTAKGSAQDYVRKHIGIEPTVVCANGISGDRR